MQHQTYRKNLSLLGVASLLCLLEFELIAKLSDLARGAGQGRVLRKAR